MLVGHVYAENFKKGVAQELCQGSDDLFLQSEGRMKVENK
jgi:hypothetical protein